MNLNKLFTAAALIATVGSAVAQQTEFIEPGAQFRPALTRAEVRQAIGSTAADGALTPYFLDGQDVHYARGTRTRTEVRAEARNFRQSREAASGLEWS